MWTTSSAKTFRVWFVIEYSGQPRAGLVNEDFTVRVVTVDDAASTSATVVESTQVPGVYYFDVPSSFLTTHGVGQYMVVIQTDTVAGSGSSPIVMDVTSEILIVHQNDIDLLEGRGMTTAQSTMLLELYRIMGLDPTQPLVVSNSTRRTGNGSDITQAIAVSNGVVTVTRN